MLIAIEGPDGCGKDTVANALAQALGADRLNFPNRETLTGRMIDGYLKRKWQIAHTATSDWSLQNPTDDLSALAFQALQIANRMEVMPRLIEARDTERHLVLARYWQSGWVYGQLDGLPAAWLEQVHAAMAQPQLHILLDAPAEVCMGRRDARDGRAGPEFYEGRLELTGRIRKLYRQLWRQKLVGDEGDGPWHIVEADRDVGLVCADVIELALEAQRGS